MQQPHCCQQLAKKRTQLLPQLLNLQLHVFSSLYQSRSRAKGQTCVSKASVRNANGLPPVHNTYTTTTTTTTTTCSNDVQSYVLKVLPSDMHGKVEKESKLLLVLLHVSPDEQAKGFPPFLQGKLRLDAYLSTAIPDVSRAKVQSSIAAELVTVNGKLQRKASALLKPGDTVQCTLLPPEPVEAIPEAIPLEVVYEDDDLIVVNKAAGMVVHVSPGHYTGTLVNALLHHCGLPPVSLDDLHQTAAAGLPLQADGTIDDDGDDDSDTDVLNSHGLIPACIVADTHLHDTDSAASSSSVQTALVAAAAHTAKCSSSSVVRPGIVHRLDKGTTGLMVVAKTEHALRTLAAQFKARTVGRTYVSVTAGVPASTSGRVETNIARDTAERKRMAVAPYGSHRGRTASSNYRVLEVLAAGGAAVVEWKLDTGRTHQIRVHAKHLGHPLLGDDVYGGASMPVVQTVCRGRVSLQPKVKSILEEFARPALHARTLAFVHPSSGKLMSWTSELPEDFSQLCKSLRDLHAP